MLTNSGLRLGVALPQAFPDGQIDRDQIGLVARRAEELGFDDLWVIEQITGGLPVLEPVTLLAYVAALTSRIGLGTSVLITNLRNPVQLAKALSSLDQLSNGRLIAGIGLGTNTRPYATFGVPDERRVARFIEGVRVMRALWAEPEAHLVGEFWRLDGAKMEPKPLQRPNIPLWFGARVPEALQRAVRLGDGWMGAGSATLPDFLEQLKAVRSLLPRAGRDEHSFGLSKRLYIGIDADRERARERLREWIGAFYGDPSFADRWGVTGNPDDIAKVVLELREAGVNHLLLNPLFDYPRHLELIAKEIAPYV